MIVIFSSNSNILKALSDANYHVIDKFITLSTLPVFALIIIFSVPNLEKVDKLLLIFSTSFYIVLRIIVLEFIMPYDYQNYMVDEYFTSSFYIDTILIMLSYIVIFGSLYYVANNKLRLSKHWAVFCGMVVVQQIVLILHPTTLVFFLHRNIIIPSNLYKGLLLTPAFVIRLLSGVSALKIQKKELF